MNQKGFTIIETTMAMVIFAMCMLAAVQLHFSTARNNRNGNVLTMAQMAVKERLEILRGQDIMDLVEGDFTEQVGLVMVNFTIIKDPTNLRLGRGVVTGVIRGKTVRVETLLENSKTWRRALICPTAQDSIELPH
jgi:prepilin-type N-terminal cleavage/methylation domain-containing protein